jgi:hypothetical protein
MRDAAFDTLAGVFEDNGGGARVIGKLALYDDAEAAKLK